MEWMKKAIGAATEGSGVNGEAISDAMNLGLEVAEEMQRIALGAASELMGEGKPIEATVVLAVAAWRTIGWVENAMHRTSDAMSDKTGTDGPVNMLWTLMEAAFRADSPEAGVEQVKAWSEKRGHG